MLPHSQDPKYFLEGGFPSPCLQCSAAKSRRAFEGEDENAKDAYVVDSYHIAHAGSTVTAKLVYEKEHYGMKFLGVSIDRTCCASTAKLQGVVESRLV